MRWFLVVAMSTMLSVSAFAADWPSLKDFERYSHKQMMQLPQVRVPLGKRLHTSGLRQKSYVELLLMKNSIFAQTGTTFKSPSLDSYFRQFSYYGHSKGAKMKDVDDQNVHAIVEAMKHANKGSQPIDGDEGYGYGDDGYDGYGGDGYYGGENN